MTLSVAASQLRMMIVDDEEFDQRFCARALRRMGLVHTATGFTSAADALAHFADPHNVAIDLILLDINMPGMSGLEFLDGLATLATPNAASVDVFVMLTTPLTPPSMARARASGHVRGFVDKPMDTEKILLRLGALAERRGSISPGRCAG